MSDKSVADLSNMQITEVAVCRQGMNQGAKVALFKSADGTPSSSTSSEVPSMSTASGTAPPGTVAKNDFTPCTACKDPAACTKAGACSIEADKTKNTVTKAAPLAIPTAAPATDPLAKSAKEIMDDLFKGIANPAPGLVAGVMKAVADAKDIGGAEVKKATDAIEAGNAALAKADDDDAKTFSQVLPAELAWNEMWRMNDALTASFTSILRSTQDDASKIQMIEASLDEFRTIVGRRMAALIAAANAGTDALIKSGPASSAGAQTPPTTPVNKGDSAVSGNNTPPLSDTLAKAATVDDILKALPDGAAKLVTDAIAKGGAATQEDPIAKALAESPLLKAQFEAMQKTVDEATAIAKAEKEAREHTARVAKAGTDFPHLPTSPENMAGVLKAMEGLDEPVRKTLEEVLKAGNEAIGKKVLGGEIGTSMVSKAGAYTTLATIDSKAADLMKVDASLTKADAIEKVLDSDVQLQKAYLEEMK
ncbi:hypothetical protein ABMY26_00230 (plasmid) [Azospirillum sp. HJ39]|uniref:hypothetical protein n=1 Tax=Azospirillum sp. HJ39 TaxID=3159496 RepID=UPI00355845B9